MKMKIRRITKKNYSSKELDEAIKKIFDESERLFKETDDLLKGMEERFEKFDKVFREVFDRIDKDKEKVDSVEIIEEDGTTWKGDVEEVVDKMEDAFFGTTSKDLKEICKDMKGWFVKTVKDTWKIQRG